VPSSHLDEFKKKINFDIQSRIDKIIFDAFLGSI